MKSPKRSSLFTNNPTIPQMEEYVLGINNFFLQKKTLFYSSVNVETANEEVFGTITSMDTMPVHPHIVS